MITIRYTVKIIDGPCRFIKKVGEWCRMSEQGRVDEAVRRSIERRTSLVMVRWDAVGEVMEQGHVRWLVYRGQLARRGKGHLLSVLHDIHVRIGLGGNR